MASGRGDVKVEPEGPPAQVHEFERLQTAIIQAHLALQARAAGEARLRAVVATAVDAITVTDGRGIIQSLNAAAAAICGYSQVEAVGASMLRPLHEVSGAKLDNAVALARNQHRRQREAEGYRQDGSIVPVELSVAAWHDEAGD